MTFDRWQAPDRDSPTIATFDAQVELSDKLDAIMQAEGRPGTREDVVREASGVAISRPRRWHKMFERMGLLYQDDEGNTQLTQLGLAVRDAKDSAKRDFRRRLATDAIAVLRKYQLQNPADTLGEDTYPPGTNLHPYWAVWKAAVELGGRLHWDELNRELMWVLRHEDLDAAIARIRQARTEPGYDPIQGGAITRLRDRAYDQTETTDDRDPAGQVRDQKTTPWFKRAGFGEILMVPGGRAGNGYWSIHPDVLDLLEDEVRKSPPPFEIFSSEVDWFEYFGSVGQETLPATTEASPLDVLHYDLLMERKNVVFFGPPGTGKTFSALEIASAWESANGPGSVFKVTFHPSYGYEDFVLGLRPNRNEPSVFVPTPGILLVAAERAESLRREGKAVLLLIDEINRGDVARIFGELITYIEPEKRGIGCYLAQRPEREFAVPENLFFLGTMNTADKSISLIDVALRRRFAFVDFPSDSTVFEHIATWASSVSGISLRAVLEHLNEKLALEGIEADRNVGHALLRVDSTDPSALRSLRRRFQYDIVPLVAEYCYLDRERMRAVLGGLIDAGGRFACHSDTEFENALRAWLGMHVGPGQDHGVDSQADASSNTDEQTA
ncbi:McrB family protein [Burkholderia gladioli]|uniref:McrB family protein n=1 Tax=Burkholderia gladioli TaxID=28095 RepID=UPI0009B880D9|nr:AAA family ATPase [Burkholderia gladioli]